jgi:hypothetical protein
MNEIKNEDLEIILLEHCYDMTILKRDAEPKKKESILDTLFGAIVRSDTPNETILEFINDIKKDTVFDVTFFKKGGNVYDYINPKWQKICKYLYRQRSVGLGTPNAASGEGELMFLFISKRIKKPSKGDLLLDNTEKIELKGEDVRVNGLISGVEFRKKTVELCKKWGLEPNIAATKVYLEAVEIEKPQHQDHWIKQLSKLNSKDQKDFILSWFQIVDPSFSKSIDHLFRPNFDFEKFKKEIVKSLYSSMVSDRNFDKFIILGDGTNAKIFDNNIDTFNNHIDNGNIQINGDYFRINQDANIGWYIS